MAVTLGEIIRCYGDEYRTKYAQRILPSHRKAMRAIEQCRTEALGGKVYHCPKCGEVDYKYHSCRNRHCPQCQHEQTQRWLDKQEKLLLPVDYFLLTFTIPSGLREVARTNQKLVYDLFFKVTAEACQALAQDQRYVGGQLGLMGVLHTWTRTLVYHPHIHYLVPGGGISAHGEWLPAHWRKFLFPVKALSKLVRSKFHQALRKAGLDTGIPDSVWRQNWVVHCKPAGNGQTVLKYLAPYVFHTAISNRRLLKLEDHGNMTNSLIAFAYRTTKTGQNKTLTLSIEAFLQRFLQHVLPKAFVKVRYFGLLAAPHRKRLAALRQKLVHETAISISAKPENANVSPEVEPQNVLLCPKCEQPMRFLRLISRPECRSP